MACLMRELMLIRDVSGSTSCLPQNFEKRRGSKNGTLNGG